MSAHIVLIEDNPSDILLLEMALREHGLAEKPTVLSDVTAIGKWFTAVNEGTARVPQLVALDLNLPKFDSFEFMNQIRTSVLLKQTPLAVLTSSGSPEQRQRAESLGVAAFIQKPMDLGDFMGVGAVLKSLLLQG